MALLFQNSNIMNIMNMMYFPLEIPNFQFSNMWIISDATNSKSIREFLSPNIEDSTL